LAAALLCACASTPTPAPGQAAAFGYLRLVPREGVVPPSAGSHSYGDREFEGVDFVDYSKPGFAVVYAEPQGAGGAQRSGDPTALVVRAGATHAVFDPPYAALGAGGEITVANQSAESHVVSCPSAGLVKRIAPWESIAIHVIHRASGRCSSSTSPASRRASSQRRVLPRGVVVRTLRRAISTGSSASARLAPRFRPAPPGRSAPEPASAWISNYAGEHDGDGAMRSSVAAIAVGVLAALAASAEDVVSRDRVEALERRNEELAIHNQDLERRLEELEQRDRERSKAETAEKNDFGNFTEWARRIRISGSANTGYYYGGTGTPFEDTSFSVWDARLFLDADLGREITLGDTTVARNAGSASVEHRAARRAAGQRQPARPGRRDLHQRGPRRQSLVQRQVGVSVPVGENYLRFSKGYRDNPFITNTAGGPWWWDEGVRVYGSDDGGRFGYVASISDGETDFSEDASRDPQFTLKLYARPTAWFYASVSALRSGRVGSDANDASASGALWLGETWATPVGHFAPWIPVYQDGVAASSAPSDEIDSTTLVGVTCVHAQLGRLWLAYGPIRCAIHGVRPRPLIDRRVGLAGRLRRTRVDALLSRPARERPRHLRRRRRLRARRRPGLDARLQRERARGLLDRARLAPDTLDDAARRVQPSGDLARGRHAALAARCGSRRGLLRRRARGRVLMHASLRCFAFLALLATAQLAHAGSDVRGRIVLDLPGMQLADVAGRRLSRGWARTRSSAAGVTAAAPEHATFAPSFLATGQSVSMPNDDEIFHNVFSYSAQH
jgi:hypothetical protein